MTIVHLIKKGDKRVYSIKRVRPSTIEKNLRGHYADFVVVDGEINDELKETIELLVAVKNGRWIQI